jgi:hypothetical protein
MEAACSFQAIIGKSIVEPGAEKELSYEKEHLYSDSNIYHVIGCRISCSSKAR